MRGSRRGCAGILLLAALLLAAGCSSTGAPEGWLPEAVEAGTDPFGAWIRIRLAEDRRYVAGEFLAVDADSVYILTPGNLEAYPRGAIKRARLAHFDPMTGRASSWVLVGTLSTASHGIGLIITAPLWMLMGGLSAGAHSRNPLKDYPAHPWEDLSMYARYPQGPPPNLRDLQLRDRFFLRRASGPPPDEGRRQY